MVVDVVDDNATDIVLVEGTELNDSIILNGLPSGQVEIDFNTDNQFDSDGNPVPRQTFAIDWLHNNSTSTRRHENMRFQTSFGVERFANESTFLGLAEPLRD